MNGYPRQDGSWEFYAIQSLYNNSGSHKWGDYPWCHQFDNRRRAEALGLDYEEVSLKPSGRIWQSSGIHGTTSLEYASVLLRLCRKGFPEHGHRIVRMTVSRQTEVIE